MRSFVTTLAEIAGAACIVAGAWAVFWPAGLVALGVALLAGGWLGER
jgi:hypothetical protein